MVAQQGRLAAEREARERATAERDALLKGSGGDPRVKLQTEGAAVNARNRDLDVAVRGAEDALEDARAASSAAKGRAETLRQQVLETERTRDSLSRRIVSSEQAMAELEKLRAERNEAKTRVDAARGSVDSDQYTRRIGDLKREQEQVDVALKRVEEERFSRQI